MVFSWSASNPWTSYYYNVNSSKLLKLAVVLYLVLEKHIGQMSAGLSAVLIEFIMVYLIKHVCIYYTYVCNEIYNNIILRFKFGFIFRNYKFYYLWNQEMVSHLLTADTAYHSKRYNSSYLEYFRLPRVAWPEEFISCYFVSINATDFGYWTHSLNTRQDDYTTRVPAVAYHRN